MSSPPYGALCTKYRALIAAIYICIEVIKSMGRSNWEEDVDCSKFFSCSISCSKWWESLEMRKCH